MRGRSILPTKDADRVAEHAMQTASSAKLARLIAEISLHPASASAQLCSTREVESVGGKDCREVDGFPERHKTQQGVLPIPYTSGRATERNKAILVGSLHSYFISVSDFVR